jgi:uncharacterized protein (DUF1330 family)
MRSLEFLMPKAYWVVSYRSISDPQKVAAYAKLAPAATAAFGARYVARGNAVAAHEDGRKERVVITEFPSLEQATAAYDSPAYQDALKALGDGAVRDVRIIEGME